MQKNSCGGSLFELPHEFFAKYGFFMNKSWIFIALHENSCYTETYSTFLKKG